MKKGTFFFCLICVLFFFAGAAGSDPLSDLMEQFTKDYNAAKPPSPYSSVDSDYKIKQAALGSIYTTRTLALLYRQNEELVEKYDEMLRKYDEMIEQNKQIIDLLSALANGGRKDKKVSEQGDELSQ